MTDLHFLVKQRRKKTKHPDTRGCKAADFLPTGRSSVPTRPGTSGMEHSRQTPRKRSLLLTWLRASFSQRSPHMWELPSRGPRLSNAAQPADCRAHCQGGKKNVPPDFSAPFNLCRTSRPIPFFFFITIILGRLVPDVTLPSPYGSWE